MVRSGRIFALLLCLGTSSAVRAQDATSSANPNASVGDDVKAIKESLEQQSRQIDVLAQEVARLNLLLEAKTPGAEGLAPVPAGEGKMAAATAAAAAAPAVETVPGAASVPKAVAADAAAAPVAALAGQVHVVAKGETLTAIAHHYKVTVPDLLKVNKISDVRKLQIGQTLALPPDAKIPESSATPPPKP